MYLSLHYTYGKIDHSRGHVMRIFLCTREKNMKRSSKGTRTNENIIFNFPNAFNGWSKKITMRYNENLGLR